MTINPIDAIVTYYTNRIWVNTIVHEPPFFEKIIFVGELEDILDKKFGLFLQEMEDQHGIFLMV